MTRDISILAPVVALAGWTFGILLLLAYRRLRAGFSGAVHLREFALGDSENVPLSVVLANRNYMNLLELPVLFYVGSIWVFVLGAGTTLQRLLAWGYVVLRVIHSIIHVTHNRIVLRFYAFLFSNIVLLFYWITIVLQAWYVS